MSSRTLLIGAVVVALLIVAFAISRSGKPEPDAVLRQCLDSVVAKNYDRMLSYCTPELRAAYSNSLWVVHAHRAVVSKTEYTIGTVDQPAAVSAHINVEMKFSFPQQHPPMTVRLKFDLSDRGKWYIENVWKVESNGAMTINALTSPPSPEM